MEKGHIYIIKNYINNKVYIGQTTQNVTTRFKQHLKCLKTNQKQLICKAIMKYDKSNFYFEILEECNIEDLDNKETMYIKKYNSVEDGYNLCYGGTQTRKKRLILNEKLICQQYLQGYSSRQLGEIHKVSSNTIQKTIHRNDIVIRNRSCNLLKYSKISEQLLKEYLQQGLSKREIAKRFNVNPSAVKKAIEKYHLQNIIIRN